MKKNTVFPTKHNISLKLEVGNKVNSFCSHNIYKVTAKAEDNSEITMPSKNYFFVGNKFYVPYNNYVNDEYLAIPNEYRYIKIYKTQNTDKETEKPHYILVICNQYGKEYSYNYHQFYIQPENIIEVSKETNLEEYYKIQQEYNGVPLFKVIPESHNNNISTTRAVITNLHNVNTQIAKLSPESLQYKHYHSFTNDKFILSYSDITKHQINNDGSITLHNIKHDITQKIIEDNPIFLVVHNGNFYFTDKKQDGKLVDDYNTAIKVLQHANFEVDADPCRSNNIDMNKPFIFKVVKGDLDPDINKNIANVALKDQQIPLIPKDNNTHLFFNKDNSFEYYNNIREVIREDAAPSGFTKPFFKIVDETLDSNNIYLSIKLDKHDKTKIYFSDQQGNTIFNLPDTTLKQHISSLFHIDDTQQNIHTTSTEDLTDTTIDNFNPHNKLQDDKHVISEEKLLIPHEDSIDSNLSTEHQERKTHLITDKTPNTTHFPLTKEKITIENDIGDSQHHTPLNLMYDEILDFYKAIKENYNHDYILNAFNNIIKHYGTPQQSHENNAHISKYSHISIDHYDFGLLQ
ncbi:hypothetical protein EDL79_00705 [Ehrlichia ruminantium]|uniref:Uncharacterized protein n=1 Tax=Ehrlichia ruminantium TaxID=779 RepID=A0AAE6Q8Q6_EHRRU|nr:hypothetical protein [Ehrlichia ruminantium]QGR02214.1 hypothetical protein EDL81_00705 [Ehrlichia ruminantium]QGR03136.1 hypothetical protein EDL80_00705 [Ehrlichia ruminantium]QGR04061.1 hypothetical protein EDL79_00705 [Ehrlichia ruminantium]